VAHERRAGQIREHVPHGQEGPHEIDGERGVARARGRGARQRGAPAARGKGRLNFLYSLRPGRHGLPSMGG